MVLKATKIRALIQVELSPADSASQKGFKPCMAKFNFEQIILSMVLKATKL